MGTLAVSAPVRTVSCDHVLLIAFCHLLCLVFLLQHTRKGLFICSLNCCDTVNELLNHIDAGGVHYTELY